MSVIEVDYADTTVVTPELDTQVIEVGLVGPQGPPGDTGSTGPSGTTETPVLYGERGELIVKVGEGFFPVVDDWTVDSVVAAVGTAPTGAAIIVDVNINGASVFTTQANRPTVAIGANVSAVAVPDVTDLAPGDLLSVDIDQVGSLVAGAHLTVVVNLRK